MDKLKEQVRHLTGRVDVLESQLADAENRIKEIESGDWSEVEDGDQMEPDSESRSSADGAVLAFTNRREYRYYVVTTPAPDQKGGIFNTYKAFGDAVRDRSFEWKGRGTINLAPGTRQKAFSGIVEAKAWWRKETNDSAPILRFGANL